MIRLLSTRSSIALRHRTSLLHALYTTEGWSNVFHVPKGSAENVELLAFRNTGGKGLFERFLSEQRDSLVGFLRHRTTNEADAQDAAQESLVRLLRYREEQPAEAWKPLLYRIAINVTLDQARRQQSRCADRQESLNNKVAEELPGEEPSLEDQVCVQQELAAVRELILRLPARRREIYLLNRIEGLSYSEIAAHCAISVKAVEKQITKALKSLRTGLGERGFDTYKEL
jgi:RNA polymerase sigma factor (sigma-70 family)